MKTKCFSVGDLVVWRGISATIQAVNESASLLYCTLTVDGAARAYWLDMADCETVHFAPFNRFEIEMTSEAVEDCGHSGPCDLDVARWADKITRPERCTPDALRSELKEYGAWDDEQLADDVQNWHRIIWIAAGHIKEDLN